MNYKHKKKGSVLLIILLVISVLLIQITALTKVFLSYQHTQILHYKHLKAYYLAESGFAVAKLQFNSIPTIPPYPTIAQLYAKLFSSLEFNKNLEGNIYLLKTTDSVYSVGIVENKFKTIIRRGFKLQDEKIIWLDWEKL